MKAVRALILAFSLLSAAQAFAQDLSVNAVKELMALIDAAVTRGDFATVGQHMAEHATVSGTTTAGGQIQSFRMTKSQYIRTASAVVAAAASHSYERTNEKISVDGGQATITADIAESTVLNGQTINSNSRERTTVESIGGVLMVTQVVANATIL
jgi:ketosteroid isomerase-like protein